MVSVLLLHDPVIPEGKLVAEAPVALAVVYAIATVIAWATDWLTAPLERVMAGTAFTVAVTAKRVADTQLVEVLRACA
jgi:hypothetical protein